MPIAFCFCFFFFVITFFYVNILQGMCINYTIMFIQKQISAIHVCLNTFKKYSRVPVNFHDDCVREKLCQHFPFFVSIFMWTLFSCLMLWLYLTMLFWIGVARVAIPVLFIILEKSFWLFTVEYDVCLSYIAVTLLRHIPSIATLLRVFIINGC